MWEEHVQQKFNVVRTLARRRTGKRPGLFAKSPSSRPCGACSCRRLFVETIYVDQAMGL